MERTSTDELLDLGKKAAESGDIAAAQDFYIRALESDIDNEHGWALLFEVVDNDSDRQICLENLLLINPKNDDARKKLETLQGKLENSDQADQMIAGEITPLSAAAAILYPERLVRKWRWHDDISLNQITGPSTQQQSRYGDIWEEEGDVCAYCAERLHENVKRCPKCRRRISYTEFSFRNTSSQFVLFWVLVLATAQLFLIQSFVDIIRQEPIGTAIWHGILFAAFAGLALLLVKRHPAGYVGANLLLIIMLVLMIAGIVSRSNTEMASSEISEDGLVALLAKSTAITFLNPVLDLIEPFQMIAMSLALVFGLIFVGPDFERTRVWFSARVDRGLREASEYYATGQRYSRKGMWATAVLHFQRAVANEPNRPSYLWSLGQAYAELGYYERALDVLESARKFSLDASQIEAITTDIDKIHHARNIGLGEKSTRG